MDIEFDEKGNLKPYGIIDLSEKEFYRFFVENYSTVSTRHKLYKSFQVYVENLLPLVSNGCSIWIDGSFISKKENPRDIDLVSIIDYSDYDLNKSVFETKFDPSNVRKEIGVDGYLIRKFPKNHPKYFITELDSVYWRNLFGKTKVNRSKKQFPKGIIQLNFE